jgi:mannosylglycerate hydrolase
MPQTSELCDNQTLITGPDTMENEYLKVMVNGNGTVDLICRETGREYRNLNYLTDQGECGNAWRHQAPEYDRIYNALGVNAEIAITQSGPLVSEISAEYGFPVPVDYAEGNSRNKKLVNMPVMVKYRLEKGCDFVKVELSVDNRAKDHWLRANFPTDIKTDVSIADSHYDVIYRDIKIPDSTGWVERAGGTHPLRTFVDISDDIEGLAVMPKGLIEYEVFEDSATTVALTLIRACRIKLEVSEEKKIILSDLGVHCPGLQKFEYAIYPHKGNWKYAGLLTKTADYISPVKSAMAGRGKGDLSLENSLFSIDNNIVSVTAVKQAEDSSGLIVRFFNPSDKIEKIKLTFAAKVKKAMFCRMDETEFEEAVFSENVVSCEAKPKKIITMKVNV